MGDSTCHGAGTSLAFFLPEITKSGTCNSLPCAANAEDVDAALVCRTTSRSAWWIISVLTGAVDVCANVDSGEDRHDVERECVTRGICLHTVNLHRGEPKEAILTERSGTNIETPPMRGTSVLWFARGE